MPRKKVWPPRPHPHRPSGQERVHLDGRDYYLGPIGSAEARRRYAELVAGLTQELAKRDQGQTVAEALGDWVAWARVRYGAGREAAQYEATLRPVLDLFGALPVARFGLPQLEEAREEMVRRGWCRNVCNRRAVRVRTVWRWLEQRGKAPAGSWAALRALAPLGPRDGRCRATPPARPVEWASVAKVCRMVPPAVRDMLLLMWFAGMRSGEVRQMRAGEVDGATKTYRPASHKNAWRGQERAIALGPVAWRVLSPWLEGRPPGAYVFPSGPNRCYRDDSFARAVARGAERAGVEPFSPYAARHAFKQRVARAMGLEAARAAMGHKSIQTTAGYAAGVDLALARDAARKCG